VRYSNVADLVILPCPPIEPIMPTDFSHTDELIAGGRELARTVLKGSSAGSGNVVPLRRAA
jgi:hypothetical protein